MSKFVTNQGLNYRVTHTADAVPKLPPEGGPLAMLSGGYAHVSPEYWISEGTGMKTDKIKVLEGIKNANGNSGTGMPFNVVAHVQYFQTNMYYCVLAIDAGLGDTEGSRRTIDFMWPTSPAGPPMGVPVDRVTGDLDTEAFKSRVLLDPEAYVPS
jgi:hypothetical protein